MAQTRRGNQLTRQFQRNQRALTAQINNQLAASYRVLDAAGDASEVDRWLTVWGREAQEGYARSQRLGESYVREFAAAEGFTLPDELPKSPLDMETLGSELRWRGPRVIAEKVEAGMSVPAARGSVLKRLQGVVANHIQNGGRGVIIGASKYSGKRGRWRRVTTSAKPCAFCAMLAGRGPVYTQQTVTFRSHPNCDCEPEIVVGDWEPTEREHLWRLAYDEAALEADRAGVPRVAPSVKARDQHEDNILWRMRRAAPELFSDGVTD